MYDVSTIISTVNQVYNSNTNFQVLKDFERVFDELGLYVYANWIDGELASGPKVERHWVTCEFMWPYNKMPDPAGGERLLDYNCKLFYIKTEIVEPRVIRKPTDIRPGTRKGKLDSRPIWVVKVSMPLKLISDIWIGYQEKYYSQNDILNKHVNSVDTHDMSAGELPDGEMSDEQPSDEGLDDMIPTGEM